MARREAVLARMEEKKEKPLFEEDYLLGVFDPHRMGALRFKTDANGPFLHDEAGLAAPPWTSLRDLEFASMQLENETLTDVELIKWLHMLIAPGASLGGERWLPYRRTRTHPAKLVASLRISCANTSTCLHSTS